MAGNNPSVFDGSGIGGKPELPVRQFSRACGVIAVMYLCLYGYPALFPTQGLWGADLLRYFPLPLRIVLLLACGAAALPPLANYYVRIMERGVRAMFRSRRTRIIAAIALGVTAVTVCWQWKIISGMYGDSRSLLKGLAGREYSFTDLFSPGDFEPLTRMIHQTLASSFGIDLKTTYEMVSAGCGGFFILLVMYFVNEFDDRSGGKNASISRWQLLAMGTLGLAGANALFFGHVEDYTLVYLCITGFLMAGWLLFRGKQTLPGMIILFLIGTRLHIAMILLAPALLYAILKSRRNASGSLRTMLRPRSVLIGVAATMLLAGWAYFFVFNASTLSLTNPQERVHKIFLPLFNPLPAPHSYALLSWKHLLDVGDEWLFTVSPAATIILIIGAIFHRSVRRDAPEIIFLMLGAFYFCVFTLTANPILSMPRDWDLFALAAPPLTFLALALAQQILQSLRDISAQRMLIGCCLGPALLASTIFYINSEPEYTSQRLVNIGSWAYNSYYIGSAYMINVGQKLISDPDEQFREREAVIDSLLQNASAGDAEMSFLCQKLGEVSFSLKRFDKAVRYYSAAFRYDTTRGKLLDPLAINLMLAGRFDDADRMISKYNEAVNQPDITDFNGLAVAQMINFFRQLEYEHTDPAQIRRILDAEFAAINPQ